MDDLLLTGDSEPELRLLKTEMGGRFRVKDLGEAAHLLGMHVSRDDPARTVRLDQAHYIRDVAARYGMEAVNPTRLPADASTTVSATAALTTGTPATVTAAVSLELVGYSDANLAVCLDSGRTTTSGLFLLAGGVVAFASRLQHSVARSTMESEYIALFDAAQEAEQLRTLLAHLDLEQTAPTVIHEDNTAALAVAMAAGQTHQSCHIHIRYHVTRELV
ncbi:unnamed protein product, partial [Phaeothamnion confervicola]